MVNTKTVTDRRSLRFDQPEQMWADIDRIVAAERAGRLRRSGNWTAGQNLGHLAGFIDFAFDGFPQMPPFLIRVVLRPFKNKFIRGSLPRGVRIPGVEGGTWAIDQMSVDEGIERLRRAWNRLLKSPPAQPHPLFGKITHEEWKQLHLRHAELHLGFLHPAE